MRPLPGGATLARAPGVLETRFGGFFYAVPLKI